MPRSDVAADGVRTCQGLSSGFSAGFTLWPSRPWFIKKLARRWGQAGRPPAAAGYCRRALAWRRPCSALSSSAPTLRPWPSRSLETRGGQVDVNPIEDYGFLCKPPSPEARPNAIPRFSSDGMLDNVILPPERRGGAALFEPCTARKRLPSSLSITVWISTGAASGRNDAEARTCQEPMRT